MRELIELPRAQSKSNLIANASGVEFEVPKISESSRLGWVCFATLFGCFALIVLPTRIPPTACSACTEACVRKNVSTAVMTLSAVITKTATEDAKRVLVYVQRFCACFPRGVGPLEKSGAHPMG